jgi:hypothetical protein
MINTNGAKPSTHPDRGTTLLELLIVVILMGIVATTLTSVFVVIVRTAPSTEARTDDARSVQGLVTWLPEDVDATPPGGFSNDPAAWPCAGTGDGYNVLQLKWDEPDGITDVQYAVSYRYVEDGGAWHLSRFSCNDGGTGTFGSGSGLNLTSELPAWDTASPPSYVTFLPNAIAVEKAIVTIETIGGTAIEIEAAPKNPDEILPSKAPVTPVPPTAADCLLQPPVINPSTVNRKGGGSSARAIQEDFTITVQYLGTCSGLIVEYDSGDGLGTRQLNFPDGSPSTITNVPFPTGTDKWTPGNRLLTVTTTSTAFGLPVAPVSAVLSVN